AAFGGAEAAAREVAGVDEGWARGAARHGDGRRVGGVGGDGEFAAGVGVGGCEGGGGFAVGVGGLEAGLGGCEERRGLRPSHRGQPTMGRLYGGAHEARRALLAASERSCLMLSK